MDNSVESNRSSFSGNKESNISQKDSSNEEFARNNSDCSSSHSSSKNSITSRTKSFKRKLKKLKLDNPARRFSVPRSSENSLKRSESLLTEKSFKKYMQRRATLVIHSDSETDEKINDAAVESVFKDISFDFPIKNARNYSRKYLESDTPPPDYPPPPPPMRKIFYDDLSSDQSNSGHDFSSSSFGSTSYSSSLTDNKCWDSISEASKNIRKYEDIDLFKSWVLNDSSLPENSSHDSPFNDTSLRETCESSCDAMSEKSSVLSDADSHHQSKFTLHTYENWKPDSFSEDAIAIKAQSKLNQSAIELQSVVHEFDPLYDFNNEQNEENLTNRSNLDYLSETFATALTTNDDPIEDTNINNEKNTSWSAFKNAVKSVKDGSNWPQGIIRRVSITSTRSTAPRKTTKNLAMPDLNNASSVLHKGVLFKLSGENSKDFVKICCQLSGSKLLYSRDKSTGKDSCLMLNNIASINLCNAVITSSSGVDIYCFEINLMSRSRPHVFGALCVTERRMWMQKILENLTSAFPTRYVADYLRAGWCWLREGVNGEWTPAWLLLQHRTLLYVQPNAENIVREIDLRKMRNIVTQELKDEIFGNSVKSVILLDTVSAEHSFYATMEKKCEVADWQKIIRSAALNNGIHLSDQQLTKDDLPVVVDKCVNFVYAHGSMSEGIYRRSGSNSNVTSLLSLFRQDAWAIQLSIQQYSEYDVANVLKRFFRELSEPLFSAELHKHLCNAAVVECTEDEKLCVYRSILEKLPPVNYVTVRRLIGHLHFVHELREKNLMSVENLAAIWGPTLMHIEDNNTSNEWSKRESEVIHDLIALYPLLFLIDEEERMKERKMKSVLERYHASTAQAPIPAKASGDLKIWIYLHSKSSGDCVNVTVDPNKCSEDVCKELSERMQTRSHLLCIHEYICGGELVRPMHHSERILDVILRWTNWDEPYRKDNCLVITTNSIIREVLPIAKPPLTVSGELKFADEKSKSYKTCHLEFCDSKLTYYKDKKGSNKAMEWNIHDIVWYLGHEPKRNPRTRWSITFIKKDEKQVRSKESPYFGCTFAGSNKEEQFRWVAAMFLGAHDYQNLLPAVMLLE